MNPPRPPADVGAGAGAGAGSADPSRDVLLRAMPAVFVLIWSTGFVVARFGMPHAPPLSFLCVRYALSIAAFLVWIRLTAAAWPVSRRQWLHLSVVGVCMHAGYLGGVWAAVKGGLGAGTAALIVGLQPVLTALWMARSAGAAKAGGVSAARAGGQQWAGLALGLAGLVLVVWRKLDAGEVNVANMALALLALLSITAGTLYQKRFLAPCDVRTANSVQLMAALAVSLPLALTEPGTIDWHPEMLGALAWSVLVLTLGGSSLLYLLVQRGAATRVASLMYLVPPCTAVLAWMLFDETLSLPVLAGMALTAAGVWLVLR
jgi:drug/metabolite transporter (DMT)-like permease